MKQSTIDSATDVVTFLKEQHQQVKAMFDAVLTVRGKDREKAFYALRRTMAVHEAAEEEIVHPAARRALPDGEAIIKARLKEENAAKIALDELETLSVDSPQFEAKLRTLKTNVVAHAEAEEKEEFARLANALDKDRLERMKKAVTIAEAIAPTRPHAGIESQAANMIAGTFASMFDRARDALSGKS